ncbi:hypothetical protein KUL118_39450 [Tenacibaculum sp. KUL118]|nr:hypothetical protein KUL118_39450 [Tenacibaculum sp. KUL118]
MLVYVIDSGVYGFKYKTIILYLLKHEKSILNIGIAISKTNQKQINGGGSSCNTYSGPPCYGIRNGVCGTCSQYQALPQEHKGCAFVHIDCEEK